MLLGLTFQSYWFLNDNLPPRVDLWLAVDGMIPFWPASMIVYQSFFIGLIAAAVVCGPEEFLTLLAAVLLANLVCYAGFVAFTAHYPRPDPALIESPFWSDFYADLFEQDAPGNTFPSIHVAVTLLVAMRMRLRWGGALWLVWGALVCVSTLTVKQHFVVDVLGGIVVALGVHALMFRRTA